MNKIFLDLGLQPLANRLLTKENLSKKEFKFHLKVQFDLKNYLVSLKNTVSSKQMFNDNYPYRSSSSKTISNEYKKLSQKIKKKLKSKKILEIGSNDGTFLKYFDKRNTVAVEPVKKHAKITKDLGFFTYDNFWNLNLAKKIVKKFNGFDLIFSANTISHIKNLDESLKSIQMLLNKKGVFILEDPSLANVILNNTYDQFYDEHIYVFSTLALKKILSHYKLEIFKIENIDTHGGSNRYYICRDGDKKIQKSVNKNIQKEKKIKLDKFKTYKNFAKRVYSSKKSLRKILNNIRIKNRKVIGYGASAKSTLILNFCELSTQHISYFTDSTKDKQGKYIPGTNIQIKKQPNKIPLDTSYAFLGAWNFYKEIKIKEKKFLKRGGKFITHVSYARIL